MKNHFVRYYSRNLVVISLFIGVIVSSTFGQQRSAKPKPKPIGNVVSMDEPGSVSIDDDVPNVGEVGFDVSLDASGRASVAVVTSENSAAISADQMNAIYERFATFRSPSRATAVKPIDPVIIVHATPDTTYGTILKFVTPIRRYGRNLIKIAATEGQFIVVPGRQGPNTEVKPNPLTLMISVSKSGEIGLNNEPNGSLNDFSVLLSKLQAVFKAREVNGVLREGTNVVETSVWLKLPDSIPFSEIARLDFAIRLAGSDRVFLAIEDGPFTDARKQIIGN